jgi:hypothetical protein
MAFDRDSVLRGVKAKLRDEARFIPPQDTELAIDEALDIVTEDLPQEKVVDIAGDGSSDYPVPTEFFRSESDIRGVEYPAGERPPQFVDRYDDWFLYEDPTQAPDVMRLRFNESIPGEGQTVRDTFTTVWTLTSDTTDLTRQAFRAIQFKALVILMRSLAAKFTEGAAPSIGADSVDYQAAAQNFLFLSERWEAEYKKAVRISAPVKAAGVKAEADIKFKHGEDFIWHPSRRR